MLELSVEEPQTERELLLDIRKDVRYLRESHEKLEAEVHGEDGQHGLCGRVGKIENQQSRWLGRDGMVVAGISILAALCTVAGLMLTLKGGW